MQNIAALTTTLGNIEQASAQLPPTLREIRSLTADLRGVSAEIRGAATSVRAVTDQDGPELLATLQRVRVVVDNLANTTANLDALVKDNRQDVRVFARDGLPELEQLLRDARFAAVEFRELSRTLREDPSRLLYQSKSQALEIPPMRRSLCRWRLAARRRLLGRPAQQRAGMRRPTSCAPRRLRGAPPAARTSATTLRCDCRSQRPDCSPSASSSCEPTIA